MKKIFVIIAVAALFVVSFNGCKHQESSPTDILTGAQGWKLSKAFSNPPYHQSDGSYASDLINDEYLKDYEREYVLVFNTTGGEIVRPGSIVAPSEEVGYVKETTLGKWAFDNSENPTIITMFIPFLYQDKPKVCQILNLSKDELRIRFTVEDEDNGAKKECAFTVTYVPVK